MVLHWGICSAGFISRAFAGALLRLDQNNHKTVAIAARELERAQSFAGEFSIPKAHGSYQDLANDPDVDAVYIGTLHTEHHPLCLMFLDAGKHVLCEKPCTMNLKQLKEVLDKAKEKKLFFMEAIWTRFSPTYDCLRNELSKKIIGTPKVVNSVITMKIAHVPRLNRLDWGGGGLIDIGIYGLQLACQVFPEKPEKIIACGHLMESGVDETVSLTLLYSEGRMAHITICVSTAEFHSASIMGTEGTIEVIGPTYRPTKVVSPSGEFDFPMEEKAPDGSSVKKTYEYEAEATRQCIQNGLLESTLVSHEESLKIKEILDEARRQLDVVYPQDQTV